MPVNPISTAIPVSHAVSARHQSALANIRTCLARRGHASRLLGMLQELTLNTAHSPSAATERRKQSPGGPRRGRRGR